MKRIILVFGFLIALTLVSSAQISTSIKGVFYGESSGYDEDNSGRTSSSFYSALKVGYDFVKKDNVALDLFMEYGGAKWSSPGYDGQKYHLFKIGSEFTKFSEQGIFYFGGGIEYVLDASGDEAPSDGAAFGLLGKVGLGKGSGGLFVEGGYEYFKMKDFAFPGGFLSVGYRF